MSAYSRIALASRLTLQWLDPKIELLLYGVRNTSNEAFSTVEYHTGVLRVTGSSGTFPAYGLANRRNRRCEGGHSQIAWCHLSTLCRPSETEEDSRIVDL